MNDEANLVLSMELEQKVKDQVLKIISDNSYTVVQSIAFQLCTDSNFISSISRAIGQKMSNTY